MLDHLDPPTSRVRNPAGSLHLETDFSVLVESRTGISCVTNDEAKHRAVDGPARKPGAAPTTSGRRSISRSDAGAGPNLAPWGDGRVAVCGPTEHLGCRHLYGRLRM